MACSGDDGVVQPRGCDHAGDDGDAAAAAVAAASAERGGVELEG